jgi:hypothetical protein
MSFLDLYTKLDAEVNKPAVPDVPVQVTATVDDEIPF